MGYFALFESPRVRLFALIEDENEYGTLVEWYWQGKTEVLGEKPVPVPLCPPHISDGLARY